MFLMAPAKLFSGLFRTAFRPGLDGAGMVMYQYSFLPWAILFTLDYGPKEMGFSYSTLHVQMREVDFPDMTLKGLIDPNSHQSILTSRLSALPVLETRIESTSSLAANSELPEGIWSQRAFVRGIPAILGSSMPLNLERKMKF